MNQKLSPRSKLALIILIMVISISLNLLTLVQAYPESNKIDSGCCAPPSALLAKDFSAFYFASWSLLHDPSGIYALGASSNATFLGIRPHPESFKYLPSFLLLFAFLLVFPYHTALETFDILQFFLLFLIAFFLHTLIGKKNVILVSGISIGVLFLPFSTNLSWGISEAYFWQWAEGQTKVLELALILASLYFASRGKPKVSGLIFGLSFFDPRFALISIPLFLALNKGKIREGTYIALLTLVASNVPILLLPGVGSSFLSMVLTRGLTTPIYYYSYIPLLGILVLSIVNWSEIASLFSKRPILT
ncbi:MAG: glycosyltransferase 87 family protein [Nitrososphaerales archaeon]